MASERIVAVRLLTRRDIDVLGPTFTRITPKGTCGAFQATAYLRLERCIGWRPLRYTPLVSSIALTPAMGGKLSSHLDRCRALLPGADAMMIPVLMVRDMAEEIAFFSEVLDFQLAFATPEEAPFYAVLNRGMDELHLNLAHEQHRSGGASFIVVVDDVDALFASFLNRGLSVPSRDNSPVHEAPVNQTRGTREVYIDDPCGNTVIFQQR